MSKFSTTCFVLLYSTGSFVGKPLASAFGENIAKSKENIAKIKVCQFVGVASEAILLVLFHGSREPLILTWLKEQDTNMHYSIAQSWVSPKDNDGSTQNAAALLLQVHKIAMNEVHQDLPFKSSLRPSLVRCGSLLSLSDSSEDSDPDSYWLETPTTLIPTSSKRRRLISICSQDMGETSHQEHNTPGHILGHPASRAESLAQYPLGSYHEDRKASPKNFAPTVTSIIVTPPQTPKSTKHIELQNVVGTTVKGNVKGILRPKFSWRNYPELERYLIDHRAEYLQYSSNLNYTAEQKRYNNVLTQGLLDLAEEDGYLFEGFCFAAVRDRIRCYYKSYVQAVKKKQKKSRKRK